jgi:hypothetical protein
LDIRTLIFALACGNLLLALLLALFLRRSERSIPSRDLTIGKGLQAAGWYLLYLRGDASELISFTLGNGVLLLGLCCEAWAARAVTSSPAGRRERLLFAACTVLPCLAVTPAAPATRIAVCSLAGMACFAAIALSLRPDGSRPSLLRLGLGLGNWLQAAALLLRAIQGVQRADGLELFSATTVQSLSFAGLYYISTVNGIGFLLLEREQAEGRLRDLAGAQQRTLASLQETVSRMRKLEGILAICMYCKKVRNEQEWDRIEDYVSRHSDAQFSHSICPDCFQTHHA